MPQHRIPLKSLQSTRKENSWETEETLARPAVTLRRRNGPNGPTLGVYVDDDDDDDDKL
jgi:hypothetical protein